MRKTLLLGLLLGIFCAPQAQASPVELIVGREPGLSSTQRADLRSDAGVIFQAPLAMMPNTEIVRADSAHLVEILRELREDSRVRWVDVNRKVTDPLESADTLFNNQWTLLNPDLSGRDANVPAAWMAAKGMGVKVGVLDTGLRMDHLDIQSRIATNANPGETPGNSIDDDHNGLIDDNQGWDFPNNDNNPNDTAGHGSHVSGIIAAEQNNNLGISGVAPEAQIVPIQVVASQGWDAYTYTSYVASGLAYAGSLGLPVVNVSLADGGWMPSSWREAIKNHPNTLYVVSAGNNAEHIIDEYDPPGPGYRQAPCSISIVEPNVLCVGASGNDWDANPCFTYSGHNECLASYSNYSALNKPVSIYAPGTNVLSLGIDSNNSYATMSGTSMAAPMVAGAAALLKQQHPEWTPTQIKQRLIQSADIAAINWRPSAATEGALYPRLNVARALGVGPEQDRDHDQVADSTDKCPNLYDPNQADRDKDEAGNVCDTTPNGHDQDKDSLGALDDNCPTVYNPDQRDSDHKNGGDACDRLIIVRWKSYGVYRNSGYWQFWSSAAGRAQVSLQTISKRRWKTVRRLSINTSASTAERLSEVNLRINKGYWRIVMQVKNSYGKSAILYSKKLYKRR